MGFFSRFRQQPAPTPKIEGLLGYYGLGDWWLTTFSDKEREDIEAVWGYITIKGHPIWDERPLTRGHVTSNPLSAAEFLMVMGGRGEDSPRTAKVRAKVRELRGGELPGYMNGTYYTEYMKQAKELLRNGKVEEADATVNMALTGLEEHSRIGPFLTKVDIVPPASYWDFAVLYRKLKDYAREVAILERFTRQPHQSGRASDEALERLEKARALLAKSQGE
jgi:hypothetical protein